MFESKESKGILKWGTVTGITISIMGFIGTQLWAVFVDKMETIKTNKEAIIAVQSKVTGSARPMFAS